jgi:YVTN family beta-propeller protein
MTSFVHNSMQRVSTQRRSLSLNYFARFATIFRACASTCAVWIAAASVLIITCSSTYAQTGPLAYVANLGNGTTTVIDTVTKQIVTTIAAGGSFDIAATSDGKTVYALRLGPNRAVVPINTVTNTTGTPIPIPNDSNGIAVTPDNKTVYAAITDGNTVIPIDVATHIPGTPITVQNRPKAMGVTPDGKTLYVASDFGGSIVPVNVATNTPGTPISVPSSNSGFIRFTPDGKTAYVSTLGNRVEVIDVATNTLRAPITGFTATFGLAITPDGKTLYVTTAGTTSAVVPVDVATGQLGAPIPVPHAVRGADITPDGKTVFVVSFSTTNGADFVTPIDVATNTLGTPIQLPQGSVPEAIVIVSPPCPVTFTPTDTPFGQPARNLAVTPSICQTNSAGVCINPTSPGPSSTVLVGKSQTVFFSTFVNGKGTMVPYDPANNRIFILAKQGTTAVGEVSAAVKMVSQGQTTVVPLAIDTAIVSAVAPNARTTIPGTAVTAFGTIINAGQKTATSCSLALPSGVSATFLYQTTNPATNVPNGTPNTPVDIPPGAAQTFYFAVTPTAAFTQDISIVFTCTNTNPAPQSAGLNTFLLTSSSTPVADMLSTEDTPSHDGNIVINGVNGTGLIVSASINLRACTN